MRLLVSTSNFNSIFNLQSSISTIKSFFQLHLLSLYQRKISTSNFYSNFLTIINLNFKFQLIIFAQKFRFQIQLQTFTLIFNFKLQVQLQPSIHIQTVNLNFTFELLCKSSASNFFIFKILQLQISSMLHSSNFKFLIREPISIYYLVCPSVYLSVRL